MRKGRGYRVMLLAADGESRTYVGPVYASRPRAEEAIAALNLSPGATAHVVHALFSLTTDDDECMIRRVKDAAR